MIDKDFLILKQIPLFKHFTDEEILGLMKIVKPLSIAKGKILNSDSHSLYIIKNGLFEIQKQAESVYLTQSSFFGELPFCEKGRGIVQASADATVYEIKDTDLYQFLCNNYKALRGYLRIADFYKFRLSGAGRNLYRNKTQIFTVFSTQKHCGKTLLALALATSCSFYKKTILLDASYDGISVFDMCGKQLIPPISQKSPDELTGQQFIEQRIEKISESLDILNIAFGSKVKINPDIINPILFYLAYQYSYIVVDCSNVDIPLRDTIFNNSDIIIELINNKVLHTLNIINDSLLTQGQQVIHVVNRHFEKNDKINAGYYNFTTLPVQPEETVYQAILNNNLQDSELFRNILSDKKAIVFSSGIYETLFYAGMFESFRNSDNIPDIIYTAGLPYALLLAFLHSKTMKEYKKMLLNYFSDDKLHSMLEVVFPEKYLFKKDPLSAFASSLNNSERIEWHHIIPYTMLMTNNKSKIFTTGNVKELVAASLALWPLFESVNVGNQECYSSFPVYPVIPESLLRTHIQNISFVTIETISNPISLKSRVLGIFRNFVDFIPYSYLNVCDNGNVCNKKIQLPLPDVVSLEDLINTSFEQSENVGEILQKL